MMLPAVTVIIVSKGLTALLNQCLISLNRALESIPGLHPDTQVVIVDNGSPFPYRNEDFEVSGCSLIRIDRPHSFAEANNFAAARHPNDFYLLINNDVLLHRDSVTRMLEAFSSQAGIGICGNRLLFPDGTIQHCGVVFGPGDIGPYHCHRLKANYLVPRSCLEYQAVSGACMLVKHDVWRILEGFDERYPFGLEDIDFCLRARQAGWRIFCENSTASLHFESMTPGRVEKDVGSRKLFMNQWTGHFTIDG